MPTEHGLPTVIEKRQYNISGLGTLSRLPCEIRLLIYAHVLGGQLLHLEMTLDCTRLMAFPCAWTSEVRHNHPELYNQEHAPPGRKLSALLQTSHAVHAEAIASLYTHNTFAFTYQRGLSTFLHFTRSVLPCRLATIGDLSIHTQVECFEPRANAFRNFLPRFNWEWEQTRQAIATQMTGMKRITVRLHREYQPPLRLSLEEKWVKAMLLVKEVGKVRLRVFRFYLYGDGAMPAKGEEYKREFVAFRERLVSRMVSHNNID